MGPRILGRGRRLQRAALYGLGAATLFSTGCATPEPAPVLSTAEVVEILVEELPSEICGGQPVFTACLAMSETECEEAITPIVARCGQDALKRAPADWSIALEEPLGEEIGACSGQGLMLERMPHLSIVSECLAYYR